MEIDAVQIIAGLFGRDGKAGFLDEALEVAGGEREAVRQLVLKSRADVRLAKFLAVPIAGVPRYKLLREMNALLDPPMSWTDVEELPRSGPDS